MGGASSSSSCSSPQQRNSYAHVGPRIQAGKRKKTPAQRAESLFVLILKVLDEDWRRIRSLNLGEPMQETLRRMHTPLPAPPPTHKRSHACSQTGVRSGTSIGDSLLLQKLHHWVRELHGLCITQPEAADALGALCRQLEHSDMQQLQVMLDTSGHSELSDFVRLLVFNVSGSRFLCLHPGCGGSLSNLHPAFPR
jgi:hypothetical protein